MLATADARVRPGGTAYITDVGMTGQKRLKNAKVLVVGAGGLGSPALLYLAAAGVGTLGIVDFDVVDESNLQRQVIHNTERIGQPKTESARKTIEALKQVLIREFGPDVNLANISPDEVLQTEAVRLGIEDPSEIARRQRACQLAQLDADGRRLDAVALAQSTDSTGRRGLAGTILVGVAAIAELGFGLLRIGLRHALTSALVKRGLIC